mgnify:CR=1 FL=1
MKDHSKSLALAIVETSPAPSIVGDPRLWVADALEACPASVVARRLGCSQELVRGWRNGRSLPNLDHLARAPRRFTLRVLASLDAHVADIDQLVRVDPDEALRLLFLAFAAVLADLSRKPLGERSAKERLEIEEKLDDLADEVRRAQQAVRKERLTVDTPAEDKGPK